MRFCFLIPQMEHYSPVSGGAIATITANVSAELEARGHLVAIVGCECADPIYKKGLFHPVDLGRRSALLKTTAHLEARLRRWDAPDEGRFYSKVLEILVSMRPDVVVLANDLERITAVRRLLPDTRIVVWVHNKCRMRGRSTAGLYAADAFLCCSDYIKNWLLCEYGLDAARVLTAYAGVDRGVFYPSPQINTGPELRVLFTGRLDPNKGVDRAVNAVGRLRKEGVRIRLSVAGNVWFYSREGSERDRFQRSLRAAMEEAEVDWMGHVPRRFLPGLMRSHDVALALSRSDEPFGLVVLESMASGLAVIASLRGGLGEACGGAAMVADPDDADEVERLLYALSQDEAALRNWKGRSLERVKTACWSETAEVLCQAVDKVGVPVLQKKCGSRFRSLLLRAQSASPLGRIKEFKVHPRGGEGKQAGHRLNQQAITKVNPIK